MLTRDLPPDICVFGAKQHDYAKQHHYMTTFGLRKLSGGTDAVLYN